MAQLSDLQFVGYRDIFADINKILCPDLSFREIKDDIANNGGLLTMIHMLTSKVAMLENNILALELQQRTLEHTIQEMASAKQSQPVIISKDDLYNDTALHFLIRDIAVQVVNEVFDYKINGLRVFYQGDGY